MQQAKMAASLNETRTREVLSEYKRLESLLKIDTHLDRVTYDAPVNFNESMRQPRHRWFPYKEGFSPSFVRSFISRFCPEQTLTVLDPFAGVGTTILESCLAGHSGIGFDVNPLASFISSTKAISVSTSVIAEFKDQIKRFSSANLQDSAEPPANATVKTYFEPAYLDALLRIKAFIDSLTDGPVHALFKLAYLNTLEHYSTHRKAGNGLKRKTRIVYQRYGGEPLAQIKTSMLSLLHVFLRDLELIPTVQNARFILGSSLEELESSGIPQIDCVLTSPPYANCFDYSKIYICELWLGDFFTQPESQKEFRMKSVRSHVHATWPDRHEDKGSRVMNELIYPLLAGTELWSKSIPNMLRGYFMDLGEVLNQLSRKLKPGSPVGFVVSNSVYGGIPIATDLLLTETALPHGFEIDRIEIYRHMIPSSQQFNMITNKEYLRESLVVLRKQ
jgi:hypothetical protein